MFYLFLHRQGGKTISNFKVTRKLVLITSHRAMYLKLEGTIILFLNLICIILLFILANYSHFWFLYINLGYLTGDMGQVFFVFDEVKLPVLTLYFFFNYFEKAYCVWPIWYNNNMKNKWRLGWINNKLVAYSFRVTQFYPGANDIVLVCLDRGTHNT